MKWNILVEESPDAFREIGELWDDGFAEDGSQWGEEESNAVTAYLASKKAADEKDRCFAAKL